MSELRIAVLNGGDSAEADVSRSSARGVIAALRENFGQVTGLELDADIARSLAEWKPDLVFPILHGPPGEDGTLQGFLEILGYPYVGSDVHSSAFAMDKIVAKDIFRTAGLPVAGQCVVTRGSDIARAADAIVQTLGESVVVKPACQGSAIGVTLVESANGLHEALTSAFEYDPRLLVEELITGREITVGVIDTDKGTEPFPVIEVTTPEDSWYDFDHRYTAGWSKHLMPADLPDERAGALSDCAVAAHLSLGCRDLSRADFIVTEDEIYLLEVNTLPGMTPTSLYPDGARGYGLEFPELVKHLVERAAARAALI